MVIHEQDLLPLFLVFFFGALWIGAAIGLLSASYVPKRKGIVALILFILGAGLILVVIFALRGN